MPELPEVETVARSLRALLIGSTIHDVQVYWERSISPQDAVAFERDLVGRAFVEVGRRGKWVVMGLSGGWTLLAHLRMSGQWVVRTGECAAEKHLRVRFRLDDGRELCFIDPRKFGRLVATPTPEAVLGDLGVEPLADDFTVERLQGLLAGRRGQIKPLLLNQRLVAGLGNIYTDEVLWRAGIHPLRQASALSATEVEHLYEAIRAVLRAAIAQGGATLRDAAYRQPDGGWGKYADQLGVYGRAGQPCPRCGTAIARIVVGQRGTHYCPACQNRPEWPPRAL